MRRESESGVRPSSVAAHAQRASTRYARLSSMIRPEKVEGLTSHVEARRRTEHVMAIRKKRSTKPAVRRMGAPLSPEESERVERRNAFTRGYACALSDWIRLFNEPSTAAQVLHNSGLTIKILKDSGVEAYDLNPLRDAVANRTRARR